MIEKLLIVGFAAITAVCWFRYGCRLILQSSRDAVPPGLQQILQRVQQAKRRSAILALLALLRRECRAVAMEPCSSCGSRLGRGACDRAVLLANFECLTCCCFVISYVSVDRSRGLVREMVRIVSSLTQQDAIRLALQ